MRLREFPVRRLKDALRIYASVAYGEAGCPQMPEFPDASDEPVGTVLDRFEDESPQQEGNSRRYILRLGNRDYPFMKLVLEEHLIRGEFFLAVDTHDQMFKGTSLEAPALLELKTRNAAIKRDIEARWVEAGLPTVLDLKGLVEARPAESVAPRHQTVLVVDDTEAAAECLCLLLRARGFEVESVADGAQMLERADPARHDLILMDVEMPVMDGLEACRRLKEDPARRDIPVLLATAGAIDLKLAHQADAFLAKPFQAEILFSFIDHLLKPPGHEPAEAAREPDPP